MSKNSNLIALSMGLIISFCGAVPFGIAGESEKLNCSQENATSKERGCSSTSPSEATKQTNLAVENKKEAGVTKDKNLLFAPAQVNQAILESLERQKTGKLIFPSNCISGKESEEIHRMGQIGTMKERLLQAGFSQEHYDKFVETVHSKGSTETPTFSRALDSHQAQVPSKIRIPYPTCIPKEYIEEVKKGYRPPSLNTD